MTSPTKALFTPSGLTPITTLSNPGIVAWRREKLGLEIQHAIDAFSISHQIEKIEKLFLTGGGAASENLSATLSKNLGIVTELFNPFQGIEQTNEFALATEKPYLLAVSALSGQAFKQGSVRHLRRACPGCQGSLQAGADFMQTLCGYRIL